MLTIAGVENAFQALALDEHRAAFAPALWHLDPSYLSPRTPNLKQCWFPGFHETVGGCGGDDRANAKDRTDIADITLAWMCDQVDGLLSFNDTAVADFLGYNTGGDESTLKKSTTTTTASGSHLATTKPSQPTLAAGELVVAILTSLADLILYVSGLLLKDVDDTPAIRTPGQYHKTLEPNTSVFATNESMHPSIQHRKDLFALARVPYDPAPLREWPPLDHHPRAHQRRRRRRSAWKSIDEDEGVEDEVNEINAAATNDFLQHDRHYPTTTRKQPWPAAWRYHENDDGNGAEWARPPRPSSSATPPPPPPLSPTASLFRPLLLPSSTSSLPASTSTSSVSSAVHLASLLLFWPLHLLSCLLFLAPTSVVVEPAAPHPPPHPSYRDRPLSLPEWVIREVPGRANFEARLLPWLIREQLRRRNGRRLDWRREGVWARKAVGVFGVDVAVEEVVVVRGDLGNGVVGKEEEEDEGPRGERMVVVVGGERERERERGDVVRVGTTATTMAATATAGLGRRRVSVHARKGSGSGSVSGLGDGGGGGGGTGLMLRSGGAGRRAVSMSASSSSGVVVMRGGGVGRVSPASLTSGGGTGRSGSPGVGTAAGRGLKVLPQQPVRKMAAKREPKEKEEGAFVQGHRRSQSQTSVGWR